MKMRPAALAQLVEHLTRNEKVVSSILTGGSISSPVLKQSALRLQLPSGVFIVSASAIMSDDQK